MGKVTFTGADDNVVGETYSTARGPVLRSQKSEIARVSFQKGKGADRHRHPEEQTFYLVSGRLQVTLGEGDAAETYVVEAGQGSFHPSDVWHQVMALEDTVAISFKNLVDPGGYPQTGRLDA
jgi:quercetin dioxygenase-like cupin family protein